jgi:hypothetical protein
VAGQDPVRTFTLYLKLKDMNNDLKFELKLKQLETAYERLEQYQARGWDVMAAAVKLAIAKLEAEIDLIEC